GNSGRIHGTSNHTSDSHSLPHRHARNRILLPEKGNGGPYGLLPRRKRCPMVSGCNVVLCNSDRCRRYNWSCGRDVSIRKYCRVLELRHHPCECFHCCVCARPNTPEYEKYYNSFDA